MSSSPKPASASPVDETLLGGKPSPGSGEHPAFATTALGPADVRDTPLQPPSLAVPDDDEGPDPFVGRILGGLYRIEKRLGRGGMGTVYAAEHVHLQKQFAVKVLAPEIARHQGAVERLRQEAVAASRIEHENIVTVSNFARSEEGDVFIVMELLRGCDLAALIAQGPLPLSRAIPIALQIARALGAAHQVGIVHRDLKPENVFIVQKGGIDFVKVLDFGISKVKTADAEAVRMTKTGQLVGTPLYMSPEQARGETDVDKRCDVYALGVILYEMLTGSPPFYGDNYFQLLWKHGNEPPQPMKERNPNVFIPPALEAVVQKALAKRREDRFPSMEALEAAISTAVPEYASLVPARGSLPLGSTSEVPGEGAGGVPPGPAAPGSRLRRGALVVVGGGLLSAALIAVAVIGAGREARSGPADARGPREDRDTNDTVAVSSHAAAPESSRAASLPGGGSGDDTGAVRRSGDGDAAGAAVADPAGYATVSRVLASTGTASGSPSGPPSGSLRGTVRFESQPPGASVWLGDGQLCQTPCARDLPLGQSLEVRFTAPGHLDQRKAFLVADGLLVSASLTRRARGGADGRASGSESPGGGLGIKRVF